MCVNCEHFSLLLPPSASVEQIKYPILYQNEYILLLFFCSTHFSIIILYACRSGWSLFSNILFFFLFVCLRRRTYTHKLYGRHSIIIFFQHYTSLDCFSFHIVFRFLLFLPYLECQLPELLGWCGCAFGSSTSSFTSRQCFTFS